MCLTTSSGDWFDTGSQAGGYSPAWPPVGLHQLVVIHQQCRPLLVRIWKSHEVEERQLGGAIRLTIETCQKFLIFLETFKIWLKNQGLLVLRKITNPDALWHRLLMMHLIKSQEVHKCTFNFFWEGALLLSLFNVKTHLPLDIVVFTSTKKTW